MRTLTRERYAAAVGFLESQGRPLDLALYRFESEDGSADAVLETLTEFRNDDGGYGHSLEPDAVLAESSVLDTTYALQVMRRIKVSRDQPQVQSAMDYVRREYAQARVGWAIRPFASTETASAPWWKYKSLEHWEQKQAPWSLNPTAEVLGYFFDYGRAEDHPITDAVLAKVSEHLDESNEPLEMHDLFCLSRLTRTAGLCDEDLRKQWIARVRRDVAAQVNTDPASWDHYGLKPWGIGDTPGDERLADLGPGVPDAMLDHEIGRQEPDGGWPPFWDWGGLHPEAWEWARLGWKSVLTEQMLVVLRDCGRLPRGEG